MAEALRRLALLRPGLDPLPVDALAPNAHAVGAEGRVLGAVLLKAQGHTLLLVVQRRGQEGLPEHRLQKLAHVLRAREERPAEERLVRRDPLRLHAQRREEEVAEQLPNAPAQDGLHDSSDVVESKGAVHEVLAGRIECRRGPVELLDALGVRPRARRPKGHPAMLAVGLPRGGVAEVEFGVRPVRDHAGSHGEEVPDRCMGPQVLGVFGPPLEVSVHGSVKVDLGMADHRQECRCSRPLAATPEKHGGLGRHLVILVAEDLARRRAERKADVRVDVGGAFVRVQLESQPLEAGRRHRRQQKQRQQPGRT
mmetsp:Transcript_120400/g.374887  ORF Transcript_120400/g.374887 Transcript_120400/m.374887 type:complete len:310 (+) Transcript_120400:793-1722(+)